MSGTSELADLKRAWLAPSLLAPNMPGLPSVSDEECRELAARCTDALAELARAPAPLEQFLARHANERRLGVWFEALIAYWAERLLGWQEVRRNVRIPSGKQTLGEADLLYRERVESNWEHWELALKYYLYLPSEVGDPTNELARFVGRQARDTLQRKLHHLRDRQLKLDLSQVGIEPARRRAFVKGALFYPLVGQLDWRTCPAPAMIAAGHDRGFWVDVKDRAALEQFGSTRWRVLPKRDWLPAPEEAAARGELKSLSDVIVECERIWERAPRPVLVTQGEVRGFIAPPGWAEAAHAAQAARDLFYDGA